MMQYRKTALYQSMTPYQACAYAEGFLEGEDASVEEQCIAWQYIADTGLWLQLQSWYGRTVEQLITSGRIAPPKTH